MHPAPKVCKITFHCKSSFYNPILQEPITTGADAGDFDDQRMAEILQRLADDAELHKLLSNEKMRCEIHKSNYEKIKAEYLR